jgi:uncharacterized protein (DUF2249 family)
MTRPAIIIADDIPQVLYKLENDLEKKSSDRFRIIKTDSGQQAFILSRARVNYWSSESSNRSSSSSCRCASKI